MTTDNLLDGPREVEFTRWLESLRADVAESIAGVTLRGARPVPLNTGVSVTRALSSAGALVGFTLRNLSDTAPATLVLSDKPGDSDGLDLFVITLAGNESVRDWFGPGGISVTYGLTVTVLAGAVAGNVFLRGAE